MPVFDRVRRVIASDRSGRGVGPMLRSEHLRSACDLLNKSSSVAIVTGFFVPACGAPETDGPGGAGILGRALSRLGKYVLLYTDPLCDRAIEACSRSVGGPEVRPVERGEDVLESRPSLVVFLERLGRATDGRYYNMRSEDISDFTYPLDDAAALAMNGGTPVLAIGDGGNEAGMGTLRSELSTALPGYARCLSVTGSTVALAADVSDWGGYGLAALLSIEAGEWMGPEEREVDKMLTALVGVGAVDGVTRMSAPTVDGFEAGVHREVVRSLRCAVDPELPRRARE